MGISIDSTIIINSLITSLLRGGFYSLMAMGLSLVFGVMNIANFAHGEMYMLGAYFSYIFFSNFGLHPLVAIVLAAVAVFIVGIILERTLFYPLRIRSKKNWLMNTFLLTLGVSIILQNVVRMVMGSKYFGITNYWKGSVPFAGMNIPYDRIVGFAIALFAIIGLMLFLNKTRLGCAIRAVSQDPTGAELVGIDLATIHVFTFGLSCALAALAGGALLAIAPANPYVGIAPLNKSWFVLILVGIGNVGGSIVGGLIVGVLETIAVMYFGASWMDVISLCVIILILLLKPNGLFGKKGVKSAVE